ncbi:hypothetical protein VPHK479_0059 [Vibrio phage K479]
MVYPASRPKCSYESILGVTALVNSSYDLKWSFCSSRATPEVSYIKSPTGQ